MGLPSPPSLSSSSSSNISRMNANAVFKASCDEQISAGRSHSYNNLPTASTEHASHHHQLINQYCIFQVYDEQAALSKKRKLASSSEQEEEAAAVGAHVSTIHTMFSDPQHVYKGISCTNIEDDHQEEELIGYTTPPHNILQSTCNAAHDHDCTKIREENDHKEAPLINADLAASISDNQVHSYKGAERLLQNHGSEGMESISVCGSCHRRLLRRAPPLPPRKPKAKPRSTTTTILNFFIPPDLDLFFSSSSSTAPSTPTAYYHHF